MKIHNEIKLFLVTFGCILLINSNAFADADTSTNNTSATNSSAALTNPCNGILSQVDRPSKADSACVVPYGDAELEGGYQYLNLSSGSASAQNYPELEFRVGLPFNNEFIILPSNYNTQTIFPRAGWGATVVGILYTFTNNTEIDASFGQRITGNLGGYNNYFGIGMATLFG